MAVSADSYFRVIFDNRGGAIMDLKTLFNRMKEDYEIKSSQDAFDSFLFDLRKRKKCKVKQDIHFEFQRYLQELKKKDVEKEELKVNIK